MTLVSSSGYGDVNKAEGPLCDGDYLTGYFYVNACKILNGVISEERKRNAALKAKLDFPL